DICDVHKIVELLEDFNAKYKTHNKIKEETTRYFAIKFTSDAKLNFGHIDLDGYMTTEQYKEAWLKALGIDLDIQVEKVYAEVFNFRGYDTSKVGEDKRESAVHMVEKGSVIVFKTSLGFDRVVEYFKSIEGFGEDTQDGFGKFEYHTGGGF